VPSCKPKALILIAAILAGTVGPVCAQSLEAPTEEPPNDALLQLGPMTLRPFFNIANAGYDSNVFSRNPQQQSSDVTTMITPAVNGWLRSAHAKITGSSGLRFNYYQRYADLRSVDTANSANVQLPLNRIIPWASGTFTNSLQSTNVEIDAPVRSHESNLNAGVDVKVTERLTAGAYGIRSGVNFNVDKSLYFGVNLGQTLNRTSLGEGARVQYALTPYTTLGFQAEQRMDRFEFLTANNSKNFTLAPFVEFSPSAVISGRASLGFQRRQFDVGGQPTLNGSTAAVNLRYVMLGQTEFAVDVEHALQYSYFSLVYGYVGTQGMLTVTERFGETWDLSGGVGRARVGYQRIPNSPPPSPDENVNMADAGVGYRVGKTRTGMQVEYRARTTDTPNPLRTYQRFRIGANLTYVF